MPKSYFAVVTGAPCSGKSTYVQTMRKPGDLILDLDLIHQALGSTRTHGHPVALLPFALAARAACVRLWNGMTEPPNAWYLACDPSAEERHLFPPHAYYIPMRATSEECKARAVADARPAGTDVLIDLHFAGRTPQ